MSEYSGCRSIKKMPNFCCFFRATILAYFPRGKTAQQLKQATNFLRPSIVKATILTYFLRGKTAQQLKQATNFLQTTIVKATILVYFLRGKTAQQLKQAYGFPYVVSVKKASKQLILEVGATNP